MKILRNIVFDEVVKKISALVIVERNKVYFVTLYTAIYRRWNAGTLVFRTSREDNYGDSSIIACYDGWANAHTWPGYEARIISSCDRSFNNSSSFAFVEFLSSLSRYEMISTDPEIICRICFDLDRSVFPVALFDSYQRFRFE